MWLIQNPAGINLVLKGTPTLVEIVKGKKKCENVTHNACRRISEYKNSFED